jgi:signal transduction histidine kinase
MKKAFFTLYISIASVILLGGWGLDMAWENLQSKATPDKHSQILIRVLEQSFIGLNETQADDLAQQLSHQHDVNINIYQLEDLAGSSSLKDLSQGDIITTENKKGEISVYNRVSDSELILSISYPESDNSQILYYSLLVLFYVFIAFVIYLWVWPLFRDLSSLEKQTAKLGKKSHFPTIKLMPGSHVRFLERAFNDMSARVHELLLQRKEMTYAVSHELRTPLARIKFLLALIDNKTTNEDLEKNINDIKRDVNQLESFVSHFLGYANFDQNEQTLQKEPGELVTFCQSVIDNFDLKNIEISLLTTEASIIVHADWQLLERALSNLIENARKFAKTHILVHIESRDHITSIRVEDDGPGVAPDDTDKIFEAFIRGKHASQNEGYGLGLALVKRIAVWHGGDSSVHNHPTSGGAVFTFWWHSDTAE